ncbi:MAG: hypothetical protein K2X27_16805 [Candidatus Obscuribacterales bacterium]|nr:hypothetical protein [Candidatus Obscuribacterales bacterium]
MRDKTPRSVLMLLCLSHALAASAADLKPEQSELHLPGSAAEDNPSQDSSYKLNVQLPDEQITRDATFLRTPLKIEISAGGGKFIKSFNSPTIKHDLLIELANTMAAAINAYNLAPGMNGTTVSILKKAGQYNGIWNGSAAGFFKDAEIRVNSGSSSPIKDRIDKILDQKGLKLSPVKINITIGGSRLNHAFNNGSRGFFAYANFTDPAALSKEIRGGPLAETTHAPLRPTVLSLTIGGSKGSYCFDIKRRNVNPVGGGTLRAIPSTGTLEGFSRPVEVYFEIGGSEFDHSFNKNGSMTILTNEFLDQLVSRIKPSTLAGISELHFAWGGSSFYNCGN